MRIEGTLRKAYIGQIYNQDYIKWGGKQSVPLIRNETRVSVPYYSEDDVMSSLDKRKK